MRMLQPGQTGYGKEQTWPRFRGILPAILGYVRFPPTVVPSHKNGATGRWALTSFLDRCVDWNHAFANRFPSLFSHCTMKDSTVYQDVASDLHPAFVTHLSTQAQQEMQQLRVLTAQTVLSDEPGRRQSPFSRGLAKLDNSAIYKLLKA